MFERITGALDDHWATAWTAIAVGVEGLLLWYISGSIGAWAELGSVTAAGFGLAWTASLERERRPPWLVQILGLQLLLFGVVVAAANKAVSAERGTLLWFVPFLVAAVALAVPALIVGSIDENPNRA